MTDLRTAFPTPGGALPWGIRLEDAATRLGCVPEYGARIVWPGGDLLGLPVLRGEASAPAPDRPVLSVEYALPPDPAARGDTLPWWRELQALFGTPDALDRYEPPGGQWHSGSVRANARWRGEVLNIGGGPQNTLAIWSEFGPLLEELAGRPVPVSYGDWRPGDQRVFVSDIRRAEARLGWRPRVSPEEGIRRLYAWVAENRELFLSTG